MSHVRFFHGSTEGPPVDVYFNDHMVASNLGHGQFTDYEEIEPGDYAASVYYAGMYGQPIYSTSLSIPLGSIYTYGLSGLYPRMTLLPVSDSCELSAALNPMVRLVQLSYDLPDVDCYDEDSLLWSGCGYGTTTSYSYVYPGTRTVYLYPAGTTISPYLTVPNCTLAPNSYYSFYTYGSPTSTGYPLRMHIPLDGHSYIHRR
jgi:hypothetical protein